MKTLIKDGHIVTAAGSYVADILIDGSAVTLIGQTLDGIGALADPFPYGFDARTERRFRIHVSEFIRRESGNYSFLRLALRVRERGALNARERLRMLRRII